MRSNLLAAALLLSPVAALAAPTGPQAGIRGAFALPVGNVDSGTSFSDFATGFIPVSAEIGYRFTPALSLGLLGHYGFGIVKNCPSGVDCSTHTVGLGLELQVHGAPGESVDPWIGLTTGYEWLSLTASVGGNEVNATANGFQFAGLELGVDFGSGPVRFGPYVSGSLGQYMNEEGTQNGTTQPIQFDKAIHGFVNFGFRISFGP